MLTLEEKILDEDVILGSPNVLPNTSKPTSRANKLKACKNLSSQEAFIKSLNLDGPIYDKNSIKNYPSCHPLKYEQIIPNEHYLKVVSQKNLEFSKVHIYRTISEILELKNCSFRYNNLRIIGFYKYGKIATSGKINCHYIEERRTLKTIEIDLSLAEHFPLEKSTYLFFGTIQLKSVIIKENVEIVPYILVKFFQDMPCAETYETFFYLQKNFRPRVYDSVLSFDLTFDQSTFDFLESNDGETSLSKTITNTNHKKTILETNDITMFGDFDVNLFIDKVESDEILYYEIERLMNINIEN